MYARRRTARETPAPQVDERLARVAPQVPGGDAGDYQDEISLAEIWRIVRHYRLAMLGAVLAGVLIPLGVALLMTPVYRAETLLAPVTDSDDNRQLALPLQEFGNLAALAGIRLDDKNKKNEAIAILESRQFTEQFIEDNNLMPVLFADLWDEKRGRWREELDADATPDRWDAYNKFDDSVRFVRENRSTGMVQLSIEWHDPSVAADWANQLVDRLNARMRREAEETSNRAIGYLQEQLQRTTVVDLQQVLHRLIEAEMKKIILANINEDFAFKVIDPAVAPQEPVRPRLVPILVLGLLGGLLSGILLALILNALHARHRSADAAVSLPVDASPR